MNINDVFIKCVEKWTENELDDRINFAMDTDLAEVKKKIHNDNTSPDNGTVNAR